MPRRLFVSFAQHPIFYALFCRLPATTAMIAFLATAGVVAYPTPALAACASPVGNEGEIIYNDDFNVMQFCDGTSWISMSGGASAGAESDPQVGMTTLNKWCRGDGSSVVCDLDAPLTTEVDPKVGTLTNTKWCTTDGTTISCTANAPAAGTPGGADTQVQFNDGGVFGGDADLVWNKTTNRLGIGNTPSTELEVTGTVKASGPFWSAFGTTTTLRNLLLENFESTAVANGSDIGIKLGGTEFQGISWVKETAWNAASGATSKDTMLQFGVLTDNVPTIPMVVRADGKVGIGSTAPTSKLHVEGTQGNDTIGTEDILVLGRAINSGVTFQKAAAFALGTYGTVGNTPYSRLDIKLKSALSNDYTTDATVMTLQSDGNIGIGTTTPTVPLHVAGDATIEKLSGVTTALMVRGATGSNQATLNVNAGDNVNTFQVLSNLSGTWLSQSTGSAGLNMRIAGGDFTIATDVGNVERLRIKKTTGTVGIGTATPDASALLDVSSTTKGFLPPRLTTAQRDAITSPAAGLEIYNTTTNQPNYFNGTSWTVTSGGGSTPGGADTQVQFNDGGAFGADASFVWDNTNKRLGIGTTAPATKLTVAAADANSYGTLALTDAAGNGRLMMGGETGGAGYIATLNNVDLKFASQNSPTLGTPAMTIKSTGNVGIGTTLPDGTFTADTGGTFRPSFDISNPSGATLQLSNYITTTSTPTRKVLSAVQGLVGSSDISNYQGSLAFLTTPAAGSPTERMRIDSTGNVGIGNTNPAVKLDVTGSIVSRPNNAGASASINWSTSNTAYTSASCGAFTFSNMQDGGIYTLVVTGTSSATCSFTHAGLTFKFPPGHTATTATKMTVYSFARVGSNVFVTWIPGY